jgi:hypothetical protein
MSSVFGIEIDIEGPILTAGSEAPAYGVDTGFALDLEREHYILPGTLVKGVVRHMLAAMSRAAAEKLPPEKLGGWFGEPSGAVYEDDPAERFAPDRAQVRFGDFKLTKPAVKPGTAASLTRIAVNADFGSVEHGMLQELETPVGYGVCATFAGTVTVNHPEAAEVFDWVLKALRLLPAIGSAKGAGFGHILDVREAAPEPLPLRYPVKTEPAALRQDRLRYVLAFREPLLVASQAIAGNLFESSENIPGGVVKGALAHRIEAQGRMPDLAGALDRMIIREARPVRYEESNPPSLERPHAIPLSIYSVEMFDGDNLAWYWFEDALLNDPLKDATVSTIVTFPPDWKIGGIPWRQARATFGQNAGLQHDVRTRTSINPDGLADTSQLFSRIAINPEGHVWLGEIERGEADPSKFAEILAILGDTLSGVGKTGATASVAYLLPEDRAAAAPVGHDGEREIWRIVLETDALLHGPDDVFQYDGLSPEDRLNAQYRDYFAGAIRCRRGPQNLSGSDLSLRLFAKQRWVGGYLARRFPVYPDRYYPHLVTEAGSVFVLTVPPEARGAIASFVELGLPLPSSVSKKDFEYQRSPFPPQNGYGEVSITRTYFSQENPLGT